MILGKEARKRIDKVYGNINGLCRKLGVDSTKGFSMDTDSLEMRRKLFGRNEIPTKKPKNLLQLAWEAMKDRTLIILMICSAISIAVSIRTPDSEDGG